MNRALTQSIQKGAIEDAGKFYGLYHGIVAANDDPEKRGRVKLKVPSLFGTQVFDEWVYGKAIFNSNDVGIFAVPAVGSGVFVTFINGDPNLPIWEYGWFADAHMPKEFKERYLDGISLKHDRILLQQKAGGCSIELTKDGVQIYSKKQVKIVAEGDAEIKTRGKTSIQASDSIDIHATSDINIVSGTARISIKNSIASITGILEGLIDILCTIRVIIPKDINLLDPTVITALQTYKTRIRQLFK